MIFKDFKDNINLLNSTGLILNIDGKMTKYFGILAICLGDTPALNWLGGFKETVNAFKYCRTCEVKKNQINCQLTLRDLEIHKQRLEILNKASFDSFKTLSIKYGINFPSPLLKIEGFNICKQLLQDPMHILYEGICHLELKCFFNEIFEKKLFDLCFFNVCIKNFKYCDVDKTDIPNKIEKYKDINKFSQTSGQMSTLFHIIPLILGETLEKNQYYIEFEGFGANMSRSFDTSRAQAEHETKIHSSRLGERHEQPNKHGVYSVW